VLACNDEYLRIVGRTRAEFDAGLRWDDITPPEWAEADRLAIAEALERGACAPYEKQYLRPDGSRVWVQVSFALLEPSRDQAMALIVDVSARKAAEAALAAHRDALEAEVQRRGMELERALTHAALLDRMAAVGALAAGLGHDIGNLILPMDASAQVLAAAPLPPSAAEAAASLGRSLDYIRSLVRGLRLFTLGPQRGTRPGGVPPRADLEAWARDAGPLLAHAARTGGRHVRFAVEVDPGTPDPAIDAAALSQAALNLVQNAADAIAEEAARRPGADDAGGGPGPAPRRVVVRARAAAGDDGRARVLFTVEDDGPGMPADVLARCAEPYFTTKTRGVRTGTGLGLALVHETARRAGGTVRIDSAPGRGTRVTLDLHAADDASIDGTRAALPVALVEVRDAGWRKTAETLLAQMGFRVVAAPGPADEGADGVPADALIWITDRGPEARARVADFTRRRGPGRVVVLGHGATALEPDGALAVAPGGPPRDFMRAIRSAAERAKSVPKAHNGHNGHAASETGRPEGKP
jgi:PAS domain S-box-containing protein